MWHAAPHSQVFLSRAETMQYLAALFIWALGAANGPSATEERRQECAETKAKIRKIESKMRQGYTAKQGVRMEDELRRLREKRSRVCR
jgi:hypothetical protein